jgi:TonB family protein
MAPPTQINQELPETLPGDFVQWDEASQSAEAAQSPDAEPGPGFVSRPATEAVEAQRAGASSVNLLRGAALSPSVPERRGDTAVSYRERSSSAASPRSREIALPLHAAGPAIDELRFSAPRHPAATMAWLHQAVLLTLRANAVEITRVTRRKWPIIAAVSAALAVTLVAATIPMLNRGRDASAKPSGVPASQMTTLQQPEHAAPSPADLRVQIASQQAVSSKEPMEQVASHQAITVPPGVALSLLVQNRQPTYPSIAKLARVSGIVVLAATISTVGKVENLRVVSGPDMLRESAVDAVRTWRFKPYMLNNQPTAFETTITLNFSLN